MSFGRGKPDVKAFAQSQQSEGDTVASLARDAFGHARCVTVIVASLYPKPD